MYSGSNEIKLKISNKKRTRKFPNTWKLKTILLNNPWVKEKILRRIRKIFQMDGNENTFYNLLHIVKPVLGKKFVTLSTYIRKEYKSKISDLCFYFSGLEKKQVKCK